MGHANDGTVRKRTDWPDGLSNECLIGDVREVLVEMVGHGMVLAQSMMGGP